MHAAYRLALLAGASVLTAPAIAQTADDAGQNEGEIVVTGEVLQLSELNSVKTPTPIIDVPQSLSITTQEQIQDQAFDSLGDIVLYTPGVNQSQGEGHRDAIVFRGVRSTADFFVDGVRDDVQYYRGLYNLEQVEILRGPNALLFGRGGTGGVLNRVTKKGVIGEQFVGYLGFVDTFGAFTGQVDVNIPTSESTALRINAAYEDLNNHRDSFEGERIGINPTFRAEIGADTIIDVSYEYANHDRFVDRGIPSQDGGPAAQLDQITFADPENNFLEFEAHVLRATVQHGFSDNLKGNFTVSYGDYDKVYANLFPEDFDPANNLVTLDGYIDTTQRKNFILSGNLIGDFATGSVNHMILVGGEFIDTVNNNDRFNVVFATSASDIAANQAAENEGNPPPFPNATGRTDFANFLVQRPLSISGGTGTSAFVDADGAVQTRPETFAFSALNDDTEADVEVFSLYIQDEIEVADWLDVVLGIRYDSFDITVDNIEELIVNGSLVTLSRRDDDFSPRAGVIVKPQENISLYGSFSQSFLPRSGEQFTDINPPSDALDPDTFENLEFGLKWDFLPTFSFTAAIFRIESSSPQVADSDPGTLDIIEADVEGIEAQLFGTITPDWYLTAGYSYLSGNQVEDDGSEILRLRELPEHTFSLWSTYQVTDRFGIGAGFTYQDESFADNGNTVTLPDFIRFDASAYFDFSENLRLQVNIENVFDEEYFPNAHTADNITVGAPLNARFSISGRF